MSKNTRNFTDTQLLISEADAILDQRECLNSSPHDQAEFEPESGQKDVNLAASNPPEKTLDEDFQKIQEEDLGIQVKDQLSSSDGIALRPNLVPGQETFLKEKKKNRYFKSSVKKLFASYCEVSTVACFLRGRWVLLLSIFACSKMALETRKIEKLVPQLFWVLYCCLVYQMIENMLQYRFLTKTTNLRNERVECLFDLTDKALILFFTSILNLHYSKLINEWFMIIAPLLFLLQTLMYRRHCLIAYSPDEIKIMTRMFYMLQSFMIAAKMINLLDSQWREILNFLWVYLSINAFYALFASLLLAAVCLASIRNINGRIVGFLRSRSLGYIWHIGCHMLHAIGLIVLYGLFEKINSNEDSTLQWGLIIAKSLSFFLVTFSALFFPILKKANFNFFEDLGTALQNQVTPPKKYALIQTKHQNKKTFFLRISSTYFSQLRDISQLQFEEMMMRKNDIENHAHNKEEGNLCYICESNVSNAILGQCGHSGVCCDCALKLVEQKNECMECRKPVAAIYKIESKDSTNNAAEGIVKAYEIVEIIEA